MYLTSPTLDELMLLDVPLLSEMLHKQTQDFVKFLKEEGVTSRSEALKQFIWNIELAMVRKKSATNGPSEPTEIKSSHPAKKSPKK